MQRLRRIYEIEKCSICGQEFDKLRMHEVFTGRRQYICPECYRTGNEKIDARHRDFRKSARGKAVIERYEKHK